MCIRDSSFTDAATGERGASSEVSLPVETLSFTDSITKSTTKLLSESISLTDSISKSVSISLSEYLSLSAGGPAAPTNPVALDKEDLNSPEYLDVFTIGPKTYAIVPQPSADRVTIYDVSDPTNIVVTDTETDGANGFTILEGATGVDTFTVASNSTATYATVSNTHLTLPTPPYV